MVAGEVESPQQRRRGQRRRWQRRQSCPRCSPSPTLRLQCLGLLGSSRACVAPASVVEFAPHAVSLVATGDPPRAMMYVSARPRSTVDVASASAAAPRHWSDQGCTVRLRRDVAALERSSSASRARPCVSVRVRARSAPFGITASTSKHRPCWRAATPKNTSSADAFELVCAPGASAPTAQRFLTAA